MSASIFISHASKDVKVAQTLCSALESRGLPCWISARDIQPGENFQVSIVQALRHAKIMVLVFTANSNNSEEMTKELAIASQQRLIVIPLRVEDVTPSDAFTYEFATRQWIDVFADWETSIDQLTRRITRALEGAMPTPSEAAPAAAPKAAEPAVADPPAEAPTPSFVNLDVAKAQPAVAEKPAPDNRVANAALEPSAKPRSKAPLLVLLAASIAVAVFLSVGGAQLFSQPKPQLPAETAPSAALVTASNSKAPDSPAAAPPLVAMTLTEVPPDPAPAPVKRRAPQAKADTDIPY